MKSVKTIQIKNPSKKLLDALIKLAKKEKRAVGKQAEIMLEEIIESKNNL